MKIYDTYQEAKIENPDCDIYVLEKKTALMRGKFQSMSNAPTDHFCNGWRLCKPADYLPTLEWFFDEGHSLVDGDLISDRDGNVIEIGKVYFPLGLLSNEGYVLRAAALTETKVITESPEEKEALDAIKEIDFDHPVIRSSIGENESVEFRLKDSESNAGHEWKNGDKCITGSEEKIYIAPYPFEEDIHILADEQCVHRAHISVIKKPESLEQKRIEAMVGDFQKYNGSLFYADMAKYLIDLGWSKEQ